jgi:hypothetical protein
MMSLPSIARLHDSREATRKALKKSKTMTCECCNEEFPTNAEGRYVEECWSPLIADKPSSIVTICPKCAQKNDEEYGHPFGGEGEESGYFVCAKCEKLNVYNYSWEVYATCTDDGFICQACAVEAELDSESPKWLTSEQQILAVTETVEALQDYAPKHLSCIGGDKVYPGGVESFRETPEYKAEGMNWFNRMERGGWDGNNVREVQDCALEAFKFYSRVYITVAEAGQFQVYLDILVDTASRREKKAKRTRKPKTDMKRSKPLPAGAMPDFITRT